MLRRVPESPVRPSGSLGIFPGAPFLCKEEQVKLDSAPKEESPWYLQGRSQWQILCYVFVRRGAGAGGRSSVA